MGSVGSGAGVICMGSPNSTVTVLNGRSHMESTGCTAVVPRIPTGITGTPSSRRETCDASTSFVHELIVGPSAFRVEAEQLALP